MLTPACGLAGAAARRRRSRALRTVRDAADIVTDSWPPDAPPTGAAGFGHNEPVQIKQLRILSTVLLGFAIAQAGLGSGYLDGEVGVLLIAHATNAFAVLVLTVAVGDLRVQLPAGRRTGLGVLPAAGHGRDGRDPDHPRVRRAPRSPRLLGVLYLCVATAFCSYTWRHRPTAQGQSTAKATTAR